MDLTAFADSIGDDGPVTIAGLGTRGGGVDGVRVVHAPSGIDWVQPDEMILSCGAGTPVVELDAALAEHGQCVAMPVSGTVGGVLATAHSGIRRLGYGPVRDTLLQARYVSAAGEVVKAGGPTVKNVSGFDLCRLLVGSRGTLGFLGEVIVRTRPLPAASRWYSALAADPWPIFGALHRPVSVLWDGTTVFALLEGHDEDLRAQAAGASLVECDGPPPIPPHARTVGHDAAIAVVRAGGALAELGVGVVHTFDRVALADDAASDPVRAALVRRIKDELDPAGRLNPGVHVA